MKDAKQVVREFIGKSFYVPDAAALADDASLLEQGIVDSTGILEVVMFLEESFGIQVEDAEIIPENLDSVGSIAGFVARKREMMAA